MSVAAYTDWAALRGASIAGIADGDVAYAYGNKYVWDSSSNLTDDGGAVIEPTAATSSGRWINQGRLLELRDFAPGLTDGTTDVSSHLNSLFEYQGFLYMSEPNVQYLLESTVHIPNGGGIISVFPTAGPHGSTVSTNGGVLPGAPKFILDDGITGFAATLESKPVTGGDPVDIPQNYRGVRFENFAIQGGAVAIDTGFSHANRFENMLLQNFTKVGIIMVIAEKNVLRSVWCTQSDGKTGIAGFALADWQNSEYKSAIDTWAGATYNGNDITLSDQNIWVHRTEMTSCGTFSEVGGATGGSLTSSIIVGKQDNPDPTSTLDHINIWRFLARGKHTGTIFDSGGQVRACSFDGFHLDGDMQGAAVLAFDRMYECHFRQIRDQNTDVSNLITATLADKVIIEECNFSDAPISITTAGGPVNFQACVGELTVGTPAISAVSFDGNFQIADTTVIGKTDISTASGNVVWSPGGPSAEAKSLEYLEQARTSLRAGFIKTGFAENTTSAVCTVTGLGGTITGRITVAVVRTGERAIGQYDFEGSLSASSVTLVQGSSGGGTITLSTSTSTGVHTLSVTTSGFGGDLNLYVDVDLQGLNPDITVL